MISIPGMWPPDASILGDGPGTPRLRAISIALAAQVERQENVRLFRADYLGGALLQPDQIDIWLKTRPESAQPPSQWLSDVPLERLKKVDDGSYIIPKEVMAAVTRTTRDLVYATPEQERTSEKIRAVDGILDTLRTIARGLVNYHSGLWQVEWKDEHAVTFILTGYAPLVRDEDCPLPARSGRRQTDKHLQLAAFTAQQNTLGTPPAERLAVWNARFPQWVYKNTTNFGWDSRQALLRLLRWPGSWDGWITAEGEEYEGAGHEDD